MLSGEIAAVFYGLSASVCWGTGDFSGGVATRKIGVFSVILVSHTIGLSILIASALIFREAVPSWGGFMWGWLGGWAGAVGIASLYTGLANSNMGLVAPLAALFTAAIPVVWGLINEGLPAFIVLVGFATALVAVWLIAGGEGNVELKIAKLTPKDLFYPVLAGIGFGFFFICIDQVSEEATFWPLVAARLASISTLLLAMLFMSRLRPSYSSAAWLPILLAGIFDAGGNIFFALASGVGRLDIVSVLGSLYPAATVLLAWFILHERLTRRQWAGVVLALFAVVLIAG